MDEKHKAIELANKFITKSVFDMSDIELMEQRKLGKRFALICVDQILENIKVYHKDSKAIPFNEKYWMGVKIELNKL